ncbi:MAG: hypothetical protein IIY75_03680 [Erysipelotrichales bacterium]|nr:hypothetical protein [Erysipelotrichales bacterium]
MPREKKRDDIVYFRKLFADEIECRVNNIRETGLQLLLYKDARIDMKLLDEELGVFGWKREHTMINDILFCTVSIKSPSGEWISKQDVGVEANAEKQKSMASDAFKRACVNFGIGRELYSAPFIWIPAEKAGIKKSDSGKLTCFTKFRITEIDYDNEGDIVKLVIMNENTGEIVYNWTKRISRTESRKEDNDTVVVTTKKDAFETVITNGIEELKGKKWSEVATSEKYKEKLPMIFKHYIDNFDPVLPEVQAAKILLSALTQKQST